MKVGGAWIPVEAKLNAGTEHKLPAQVSKYTQIDHFIARKGATSGRRIEAAHLRHCLVVDQLGLYLFKDGAYVDCDSGRPIWRRDELSKGRIAEIRSYLRALS